MNRMARLKIWLTILPALALAGCTVLERQHTTLESLRDDVRTMGGGLESVEGSVAAVAARVQRFEQSVDARLDVIDAQLAKPVSLPVPVCRIPEPPPAEIEAESCETPVAVAPEPGADKITVGSTEMILITPPGIAVAARIDTGADSNSLSATNLIYFERDGDDWVRFDIEVESGTHTLERRVRRHVRVVQQSDAGGTRRPVVVVRVQLGEIFGSFEFNLSDRTHLKHPVILGRKFLMDTMVVDVSRQFVQPLPGGEG